MLAIFFIATLNIVFVLIKQNKRTSMQTTFRTVYILKDSEFECLPKESGWNYIIFQKK